MNLFYPEEEGSLEKKPSHEKKPEKKSLGEERKMGEKDDAIHMSKGAFAPMKVSFCKSTVLESELS